MMVGASSDFAAPPIDPTPCVIGGADAGLSIGQQWNTAPIPGMTPGNDNPNNMNLAFGILDADGVPTCNVAYAATPYTIASAQTGNPGGYAVRRTDCWILLPEGITSRVWFQSRGFGNTTCGFYAGPSLLGMKRWAWNVGAFTGIVIHVGSYPEVCNRKLIRVCNFCCNGYFNGGHFLQYSFTGAGYVDVPAANVWGGMPFAI